jgi:hypothetical protein
MKFLPKVQTRMRMTASAFTLPEVVITAGLFVTFVIGGMLAMQVFGIRVYQLTTTQLKASADSLRALDRIRDQIRGAAILYVGTFKSTSGNPTNFITIGDGTNQVGNALELFTTTNTANYEIFYVDPIKTNLYVINGSSTNLPGTLLAQWIINATNSFKAENFQGTILTASQNNCTILVTLQFRQAEYAFAKNMTNFSQIQTLATPRGPNRADN